VSLSTEAFWSGGLMSEHDKILIQLEQIATTLRVPVSAFYHSGAPLPFDGCIPEIQRIMMDLLRALETMSDPEARRRCTEAIGKAILHVEQAKVGNSKTKGN
jgi:hypothetical protein